MLLIIYAQVEVYKVTNVILMMHLIVVPNERKPNQTVDTVKCLSQALRLMTAKQILTL